MISSACLPACLPAVRPGSTRPRAGVSYFSELKDRHFSRVNPYSFYKFIVFVILVVLIVNKILEYSPVADPSVLNTCTIIPVDDGLLRTMVDCAGPASSSTLYIDLLNVTVIANNREQTIAQISSVLKI